MRHSPLSVFGSIAAVLVCVAPFGLPSARAQTAAPTSAASAAKTAEPQTATLSLRWVKPSAFVALLTQTTNQEDDARNNTLYSGLLRVSPDDATNRVFVQGSSDAISRAQYMAQLFDVDPRRVRLTVRILRAPANQFALFGEPDQKLRKGEVVSTAIAVFKNNEAITLHAVGDGQAFHIPLTPHVNGDGSIFVAVDVSDLPASAFVLPAPLGSKEAKLEPSGEKRIRVRRINDGAKLLVTSKPYWKDSRLAYYLEITPVVQPRQEQP